MAYATISQFYVLGLKQASGFSADAITVALDAASSLIDEAAVASGRYTVPLTTTGAITRITCHIAAWDLMSARGFQADADFDKAVRLRYEDAMKWVESLRRGELAIPGAGGASSAAVPMSISGDQLRGWGELG